MAQRHSPATHVPRWLQSASAAQVIEPRGIATVASVVSVEQMRAASGQDSVLG